MKIWELTTSEIGLTSFYLPESGAEENYINFIDDNYYKNKSLTNQWGHFLLKKEEQRVDPDFFDLYDTGSFVVSVDAAALIMLAISEQDFELLPFQSEDKDYLLFNLYNPSDFLIKEKSLYKTFANGIISNYDRLVFDSERVLKTPLFKISELPYTVFVTNVFEHFYNKQNLKGLDFNESSVIFVD